MLFLRNFLRMFIISLGIFVNEKLAIFQILCLVTLFEGRFVLVLRESRGTFLEAALFKIK